MKRRHLFGLFLLIGLAFLSACSIANNETKSIPNDEKANSNVNSYDLDNLYRELAGNVMSPKMLKHSDQFERQISFVAKAKGEARQVESKDETLNGEWYISVFLMRNQQTSIYLNLSAIKKEDWPKQDDIIRIKGSPIGYLYTSFNNERLDLLDVEAKSIEVLSLKNTDIPDSKVVETMHYKIEFTNTDIITDVYKEPSLVVYYNFKNKRKYMAVSPLKTYVVFKQNNEVLQTTILDSNNEKLDSKALNRDTLEAGEEMPYYEAFKLIDTDNPVRLYVYDDEYNLLNCTEIAIVDEI